MILLLISEAAALDVVATLPWIGDLSQRVAPEAKVLVLAGGNEDPHRLSPTPALMAKVGQADVYAEVGLSLELWSERLLDGAGNPNIRPGAPGYVRVSDGVPRLQVPTDLSRAQGDLHPEGNPHIWTDPLNAAIAADNLAAAFGRVDPANAGTYSANAEAFRSEVYVRLFGEELVVFMGGASLEKLARAGRLDEFLAEKGLSDKLGGWLGEATRGQELVFYHPSWAYFVDRFAVDLVGTIEDKPGVPPTAAHKDQLAAAITREGVETIAITSYYPDRVAKALAEDAGASLVIVPSDVGGTAAATDYFALIDTLVRDLL